MNGCRGGSAMLASNQRRDGLKPSLPPLPTPAKAGGRVFCKFLSRVDFGFREHDGKRIFPSSYETINIDLLINWRL